MSRSRRHRPGTTPAEPSTPPGSGAGPTRDTARCARRHLVFGWWWLLLFLTLGLALESFHGFKIGWYTDRGDAETRRLMWRLAHAHGTLLALLHIAFALMLPKLGAWRALPLASRSLSASAILVPGGFFLGGLQIFGGDPGPGILLVPVGALLLFLAVLLTARGATTFG